jgi:hypothetical protein
MPNVALLISYDATRPGLRPIFANQAFCDFYGMTHEQALDQARIARMPEDVRALLTRCVENDLMITSIELLPNPRNATKAVEWLHVPVKNNEGKVIEVIAIGTLLH